MTTINTTNLTLPSDDWLRRVLQGNLVFSSLSGLLFTLAAAPISRWLGLPAPWILVVVGIALLGFGWQLYQTARQAPIDLRQANAILLMDVVWVIGSLVLLFTDWVAWTTAGWWAVLLVADVVALFAILEFVGIRRARA